VSAEFADGTHQHLDEAGQLVAESIYDERGRDITREKSWDGDGKLLR
jgi:hypothetical protein